MGEPFKVEVHVASGQVLEFQLTEDDVRARAERGASGGAAYAALHAPEATERQQLAEAAYHLVRKLIDPSDPAPDYPLGRTLTIHRAEGTWVIPISSILAVRLINPTTTADRTTVGFVPPDAM